MRERFCDQSFRRFDEYARGNVIIFFVDNAKVMIKQRFQYHFDPRAVEKYMIHQDAQFILVVSKRHAVIIPFGQKRFDFPQAFGNDEGQRIIHVIINAVELLNLLADQRKNFHRAIDRLLKRRRIDVFI